MDSHMMEVVSIAKELLVSIAAATTAIVAVLGLRSWSRELRGKTQFEVFSADWMPDEHGNVAMFEFNMSPAVLKRDAAYDAGEGKNTEGGVGGDERREWLMRHDESMLREALDIVIPWEGGTAPGGWDLAGQFEGAACI